MVTFGFRNLSYKKIVSYPLDFDCYDINGRWVDRHYDGCYHNDADRGVTEKERVETSFYSGNNIHTVKNVRLTEVVFEDGTKWNRK